MAGAAPAGNGVIGLLREGRYKWERRCALAPVHCARLLRAGAAHGGVTQIIVQPSAKRIHTDREYADAGCEISEDLAPAGTILGVKQPELGSFLPGRSYLFFSHTHKAQPENMPLLDEVLEKKVSLFDYELIVDDQGSRLVAFGEFAGRAGMIDFLRGLGERFLSLGYSTPFLSLGSSYMYATLSAAKAAVLAVGEEIANVGLPAQICPITFVFTGTGNVSRGAQEIFRLLPHCYVEPPELAELTQQAGTSSPRAKWLRYQHQVFGTVATARHMVEPKDPTLQFDKSEYYARPESFRPVFHDKIAPYATAIINCMYWEQRYPRLLSNDQLKRLAEAPGGMKLLGIADITCDINGSIECLHQATPIEKPFFRYHPVEGTYHDEMDGPGVFFLAVEILPTELAREATKHFGDALFSFVGQLAQAKRYEETPEELRRACIAAEGELTPLFQYITRMRDNQIVLKQPSPRPRASQFQTLVSLNGHLFDKFLINEALDVIETAGGNFQVEACRVGQTSAAESMAQVRVSADSAEKLAEIVEALAEIAGVFIPHMPPAVAALTQGGTKQSARQRQRSWITLPNSESPARSPSPGPRLASPGPPPAAGRSVLILGAGRMCEPVVQQLGPQGEGHRITVGSLYLPEAQKVTAGVPGAQAVQVDSTDGIQLRVLISAADVVISLLPPACHVAVAQACVELGCHLVTASYVSPEMQALNEAAKEAGVVLLCEMGLDPGIDHMSAMRLIHGIQQRGGRVTSFSSSCGGLPAPAAATNPLGYKFSWSPRGAISAARNPAVYRKDGQIVKVEGAKLLQAAEGLRFSHLPAFALERLPNRDALSYANLYNISDASTVFRGTLRYQGFSEIMDGFAELGYYESTPWTQRPSSLIALLESCLGGVSGGGELWGALQKRLLEAGRDKARVSRIVDCIRWLGLASDSPVPEKCESPLDVLCAVLEAQLSYGPNEQDMVLLVHEVEAEVGGLRELHTSTLLAFGDLQGQSAQLSFTAMARTVGLPVAIGAQLILGGQVKELGVLLPITPDIYVPALDALATLGVVCEERLQVL